MGAGDLGMLGASPWVKSLNYLGVAVRRQSPKTGKLLLVDALLTYSAKHKLAPGVLANLEGEWPARNCSKVSLLKSF